MLLELFERRTDLIGVLPRKVGELVVDTKSIVDRDSFQMLSDDLRNNNEGAFALYDLMDKKAAHMTRILPP